MPKVVFTKMEEAVIDAIYLNTGYFLTLKAIVEKVKPIDSASVLEVLHELVSYGWVDEIELEYSPNIWSLTPIGVRVVFRHKAEALAEMARSLRESHTSNEVQS